jgi:hypothetical protein
MHNPLGKIKRGATNRTTQTLCTTLNFAPTLPKQLNNSSILWHFLEITAAS